MSPVEPPRLTIVADDFGLWPSYDRGILETARAGVVDAVGVMVMHSPGEIGDLLATGVEVGLHLEAADRGGPLRHRDLAEQLSRFEDLAGRGPDFLDGHHHDHAGRGIAEPVARLAAERELRVRSVDAEHRSLLRRFGVRTTDLLIGRYRESQPLVPAEVRDPPAGAVWIEWMTHPGHPDPRSGSSYDRGRGEDLRMLLRRRGKARR